MLPSTYKRSPQRARSLALSVLTGTLLCFGMMDEIVAGFMVLGLPLLRDQVQLSYEQIGLLFTFGQLSGMLFEPFMNLWSDRSSKRLWIIAGTFGMALSFVLAGVAVNYWMLVCAFVLCYPAGGASVGLAQAALIDQQPSASMRIMTRWTLLAGIGDMLAPVTVAALVGLHFGWSMLCWLAGVIWFVLALLLVFLPFPEGPIVEGSSEKQEVSLLTSLKEALRDTILLRWVLLSLIPSMLDEVFLGFTTLYLYDVVHLNEVTISILIMIHMGSGLLGLFVLDRFAFYRRFTSRQLLTGLVLVAFGALCLFLFARSFWLVALALFITGISVAGWYPIAKARAYDQRPGRSGLVRTVVSLGAPFEVALPALIGWSAGYFGIWLAMIIFTSAPLLMLLLLAGVKDEHPTTS